MIKMFVSGSMSNSEIPIEVIKSIDESRQKNYKILIGDARGVDKNIQHMLNVDNYKNVEIFHIGKRPRNIADRDWAVHAVSVDITQEKYYKNGKYTREAQMLKDYEMSKEADFGLVIWQDTSLVRGKISVSKGSLNNIFNLLVQNKPVGLYFVPCPKKGIMKFRTLLDFETEVIGKLVQEETKKYYNQIKNKRSNISPLKTENLINNQQISLFS